jgi:2-polyprenyl-3-methyl-5-hydroxy-6-metoxy-1,4-benzoquinol methylase
MKKVVVQERVRVGECLCGGQAWQPLFHYDSPPAGETIFTALGREYMRDIFQCRHCGHCRAVHDLPLEKLYTGDYMSATYGEKMRQTYDRIMALPTEQSDNVGRVARLLALLGPGQGRRVLDVGSGLCVFLARMKEQGWEGTAIDPDERAVTHAEENVGVSGIHADWLGAQVADQSYNLIAFNKVLEHVEDPVIFFAKATAVLKPGGYVYVEVPDGEAAASPAIGGAAAGPGREEFFIEHWHAFSPLSLLHLIRQSGLVVQMVERLGEPSGKYTLRALAQAGMT